MSKLRLLIKRPGRANMCIPVTVESTNIIGDCISSLVDHLGFPRRDSLGRMLTSSFRPFSGCQPLSRTMRFADAQLLPETRLVLEVDEAKTMTRPVRPVIAMKNPVNVSAAEPPLGLLPLIVNRRTFVAGSVLAVSGLFTGIATAYATRQHARPVAMPMPGMLQQVLLFSDHQHTLRAVSWSPDGSMVARGADDGLLLLWTPDGQVRHQIPHPAEVTALAWDPSGQHLASGSGRSVRFFDGRCAAPLAPVRRVHTAHITSLAWSQAVGHPLVSGSLDRRAIVWETHKYMPRAVFTHHTAAIDALSCQPGSTTVASASQGGAVRVWSVETLAEVHDFYQDAPLPMRAVAFAPMGNQLAVGGNDGQVRVWGNGLVCQHTSVTAQGTLCLDVPLRFRPHTASVRSVSWSADEHYLATGGEDGTLALWASPPGKIPTLVTKAASLDPVVAVAWSPVRAHIAVASGQTVTIWNRRM